MSGPQCIGKVTKVNKQIYIYRCDPIYIVRLKIIKIKNHEMEWTLPASSPIQSHIESLFVLTCACMVHFFYECLV